MKRRRAPGRPVAAALLAVAVTLAAGAPGGVVAQARAGVQAAAAGGLLDFSPEEKAAIARHGPWPPRRVVDPGNGLSENPAAVALGQRLFFEPRLSPSGRVACATCHLPALAFTDGRARSQGLAPLDRNAPSLWNAVHERWQGWDGAADSLWSQSIRPLLDTRELAATPEDVRSLIMRDPELACRYTHAVGRRAETEQAPGVLVAIAKAIAAFVATLQSPRTPFDGFRDALLRGDEAAASRYPLDAQRGLRLFVGSGNCALCHLGPRFSNGEFADIGLPFFVRPGVVDPGRLGGIEALRASPYNRMSRWSEGADDTSTRHVVAQHRNFGEFKVPSLRHVALTPPYMHDGQLATLGDVIRHYSELNEERLHADGERILRPLRLNSAEAADLEAFLRSLTAPGLAAWQPPVLAPCR